jgi:RNA polymerase sigma-70 factor (ECF subfamily)
VVERARGVDEEVQRLRAGDEATFRLVVAREHATLFRVARAHVHDDATAADVVQESWLAAIRGLDGFEGRASLRSWLTAIVVNQARRRGARDARVRPMAELTAPPGDAPGGWPGERFGGRGDRWPGHWTTGPADWSALPEDRLTGAETVAAARAAIDELPPRQRTVVLLRDVLGWTSAEVCDALDLTDGNERVLLHRGRSAVRRSLDGALTA